MSRTTAITVFSTTLAPPPMAAWLNKILDPVITVCRFSEPPPAVEIRPMRWGGYASRSELDGRICVTTRVKFWTKRTIASTVLHEYCHRLIFDFEREKLNGVCTDAHNPVFFLVLMTLSRRVDDASLFEKDQFSSNFFHSCLSLYDFQDLPPAASGLADHEWPGLVLNWALGHASFLADSDLPAEQLASVAAEHWFSFLQGQKQRITREQALVRQIEDLKGTVLVSEVTQNDLKFGLYLGWGVAAVLLVFCLAMAFTAF